MKYTVLKRISLDGVIISPTDDDPTVEMEPTRAAILLDKGVIEKAKSAKKTSGQSPASEEK